MRIGYITFTKELFNSALWLDVQPVFQQSFTELSRQDLGSEVKLTGTCDLFDEVKEGESTPQYTIVIISKPDGGYEITSVQKV